ncbi:MAG: hypothetical protein PHR31_03690 [Candidatus Pacebacteria bacterium]|nr:hypothetical protein [Candidatus Paceibacterota bacterium]
MKHRKVVTILILLLMLIILGFAYWLKTNQIPKENFEAPTKNWSSSKKVDDYFREKLNFTEKDFERQKQNDTVDFRLYGGSTLEAVISNLQYYGFIRNEKALMYALENTEDKTQGHDETLKVGKNGSIDIYASYRISENMTAWEMADTLLNKSTYFGKGDAYNYMFMP